MNYAEAASSSWDKGILDHRAGKCLHPEWFWDHRVGWQLICCLGFAEYVCKVMVIFGMVLIDFVSEVSWNDQWPRSEIQSVNNSSLQACLHKNMQLLSRTDFPIWLKSNKVEIGQERTLWIDIKQKLSERLSWRKKAGWVFPQERRWTPIWT